MKVVTLRLEHPGENYDSGSAHHEDRFLRGDMRVDEMKKHFVNRTPWVAEITRWPPNRSFLDGHKDYKRADHKGERGVCRTFHLRPDRLYEVCHWEGWETKHRYFCKIDGGKVVRLSEEEAKQYAQA